MKQISTAAALGALIVLAVSTYGQAQDAPAVVVAPATMQDLRKTSNFTGRVVSLQKIDVVPRVTGFLEESPFTEGALVQKGDVLYRIEDSAYRAVVDQIDGSIGAARAQERLAQIEVDRKTELVRRDAVPQSELDVVTAQLDKVKSDIIALQATRAQAELDLSYTEITAPFAGMTGLSEPDIGALIQAQSGTLTTLTMLDPISVEFPVANAIYLEHRKKSEAAGDAEMTVSLTLPDGDIYDQTGKIDFVSSIVNSGTDTVLIRAVFKNPDSELLDGALVKVELEQAKAEMVLGIPVQALQKDQQGFFVMVVGSDKKAEQRRVTVDRTTSGQAVISKGLKEKEMVITEGVNKVRPGQEVDAAEADSGDQSGGDDKADDGDKADSGDDASGGN